MSFFTLIEISYETINRRIPFCVSFFKRERKVATLRYSNSTDRNIKKRLEIFEANLLDFCHPSHVVYFFGL